MTAMPLEQLVEALQGGVISLLSDGGAAQWRVSGAELLDCPEALGTTAPGHLLLGVGLDIADRDALGAALRTAADHSCALAVKCPTPPPPEVSAHLDTTGVPVLAVDPQVPWTRVQRLVTTILAARAAVAEPGGEATGGDLFSLANAVAGIVGGAVAIMDTQQVVVAYSNLPDQPLDETRRRGILGRRVPEDALADHLDREVWVSDRVVRLHRAGDLPRTAVVIRAGEDVLGSLWVAFPDEAAASDCGPTLQEAARVAALHMLALRRQVDAEQESRDRALRHALEGRSGQGDPPGGVRLPACWSGWPRPEARAGARSPGSWRRGSTPRRSASGAGPGRPRAALPRLRTGGGSARGPRLRAAAARRLRLRVHRCPAGPPPGPGPDSLHRPFTAVDFFTVGTTSARLAAATTSTPRSTTSGSGGAGGVPRRGPAAGAGAAAARRRRARGCRTAHRHRGTSAARRTRHRLLRHTAHLSAAFRAMLPLASAELHIHQNTLRLRLRRAEELFDVALADPTRAFC